MLVAILFYALLLIGNFQGDDPNRALYNDATEFLNRELPDSALLFINQVDEELLVSSNDPKSLAEFHILKGRYYALKYSMDTALVFLNKGIHTLGQEEQERILLADAYASKWRCFEYKNQLDSSLYYSLQAAQIIETIENYDPERLGKCYYGAGVSSIFIGDLDQGLYYQEKALQQFEKEPEKNLAQIIKTKGAISYNYLTNGDLEKAIDLCQEIFSILDKNPALEPNKIIPSISYAIALRQSQDYDQSLIYLQQAEDLIKKYLGDSHLGLSDVNNIRGNVYKEKGALKLSIEAFQKSLNNTSSQLGDKHYLTSQILGSLGSVYSSQGNTELGIDYFKRSLASMEYDKNDSFYYLKKRNYTAVLSALNNLSEGFIKDHTLNGSETALDSAQYYIDLALDGLEEVKTQFLASNSKEFLVKELHLIYENALKVLNLRKTSDNSIEKAASIVNLIEGSKMQTLLERVREKKLLDEDDISSELINQRDNQQNKLSELLDSIDLATGEHLVALKEEYLTRKSEAFSTLNKIKEGYPKEYLYISGGTSFDIVSERKLIKDNYDAVLGYFVGEEAIYTYVLIGAEIHTYEIKVPEDFINKCNDLRDDLQNKKSPSTELLQYISKTILSDQLDMVDNDASRLLIISDNFLSFIPFEILLDKNGSMLMDRFSISYNSSLPLHLYQLNTHNNSRKTFGGFAPNYGSDNEEEVTRAGEVNLPGAKKEIESIHEIIKGDTYIGAEATKANFIKNAKDYDILHLAMHTEIKQNKSNDVRLLFGSGSIYDKNISFSDNELASLGLNANLAVLSACNTGIGKVKKGNGIASLSTGLAYAGVPSVVLSLWQVPDQSTKEIMVSFYSHLKSGMTKDEALNMAKKDYLKNDLIPQAQKTPYYWAGFTLHGNNQPIDMKTSSFSYLWLAIVPLLFILFFLWYRKRKIT